MSESANRVKALDCLIPPNFSLGGCEGNTEATAMRRVHRQVSAEGTQDTSQDASV